MATASTVRTRRTMSSGSVRDEDIAFGRSAAVVASIPVTALRGATGLALVATETEGGFNISLGSDVYLVQGEITDNETEASICSATVVLPREYKAGTPLTVRLPCTVVKTGAATNNGSTIDLSVYRQASGAVGSDLVTTAAQTFAAMDTWYNKDFTVDGRTLSPGDVLSVKITASIIDNEAGAGTLRFNLDAVQILGRTNG